MRFEYRAFARAMHARLRRTEDISPMTNLGKTLALIAILGTVWGVTYMHDRAQPSWF